MTTVSTLTVMRPCFFRDPIQIGHAPKLHAPARNGVAILLTVAVIEKLTAVGKVRDTRAMKR